MKKYILLGLMMVPILVAKADASTWYVATTGGGTTCSEGSPCTMDGAIAKLVNGDEIISEDGTYTAATQDINLSGLTFNPRVTIRARNDGGAILSGYAQSITIDASVGINLQGFTIKNNVGSHAIYITDSSSCTLQRIGVKNGCSWGSQYGNVVELSSLDGVTGTKDCVLEDVWVVGSMRYGILIGGTGGFSERNVLRRCVVRFDGSNSPEPHAGIANYGATTGIDGARNNKVINCIVIDFNSADNAVGEGVYAGFYNPHAATNIDLYGCISFKTKERGSLLGEDSGSTSNDVFNSWFHFPNNKSNEGIVYSRAGTSTVQQVTVSSTSQGIAIYNTGTVNASLSMFLDNTGGNDSADTNSHYWNQAAEGTGSSSTNPLTKYYLRVETNSPAYGNGGTTRRGADLTYRYSTSSGQAYFDTQVTSHTNVLLWPFPYQDRIEALFGEADSGAWATNMPNNFEARGFAAAASTMTLTAYLWEAFGNPAPTFVGGSVVDCNPTIAISSFTSGGVTKSSFTVTWTNIGGSAQYQTSMDDNSDFSSYLSSGVIASPTSGYINLSEGVTYYFKVKVSTEGDCSYTTAISTWFRFNPQTNLNAVASNISTGSFTISWDDSTADHIGVLASNSNFSSIVTSGTITSNTTSFFTLNSFTPYWFEVKVSSELFYNSSINPTTLEIPPVPRPSGFIGNNRFKGKGRFK